MDTVYESEEWKKVMTQNGLMPFHMSADKFENFVHSQIQSIEDLSKDIGLIK
jgi:putative tricarboxylic transport membrane protein